MKTIAVANQKGGVGKTTTSVNLSAALAAMGKRLLLIDLDPQGNATVSVGIDKAAADATVLDLLVDHIPLQRAITHLPELALDCIPANGDLTAAEVALLSMDAREQQLKKALSVGDADYDFVIIDCPPSLGLLTVNALCAADCIVVPLQCEFYALEGLSQLMRTINMVQQGLNKDLLVQGIVLTMYDGRNKLSEMVANDVRSHFGKLVYKTVIPRNVRISEAPSFGQPVLIYDLKCAGAQAYVALAAELLSQEKEAA